MDDNTSYISQLQMCCTSDIHVYVKVERNVSLANSHKMFQMVASFTRCLSYTKTTTTVVSINYKVLDTPGRTYRYMFLFSFSVFNCNTVHVVKQGVVNYIAIIEIQNTKVL